MPARQNNNHVPSQHSEKYTPSSLGGLMRKTMHKMMNGLRKLKRKILRLFHYKSKRDKDKEASYQRKLNAALRPVMAETGWTRETAEAKFWDAYARLDCTPFEYARWKIYRHDNAKQATFFYSTYQKVLQEKYDTDKVFINTHFDKERTNLYFSEYVKRPWCVNNKVSYEQFCDTFKSSKRVIYKPIAGHCGYGVESFYLSDGSMKDVYDKLSAYPQGVVEEYIIQHPDMQQLCPSSVNSLRFVTISSNNKANPFADIVYAAVRIGRSNSIVDNLHSGGMVANADLETGILVTGGADHNGTLYMNHPDTGAPIKGFKVPYFFEARDMVKDALQKKHAEGYLGWDLAISENGPMLLEVNNRPGATVLQTAFAQEGKGMKHVMEKYL